jgi:hypothetical protein
MPKYKLEIGLLSLMLAASSPSAAQSPSDAQAHGGVECGGQYECIEHTPLTPAEARASRGHPQFVEPQDTAQVAGPRPAASTVVVERRVAGSTP